MMRRIKNAIKLCLLVVAAASCFAAVACGSGESQSGSVRVKYTVSFDTNTEYLTNTVLDQKVKEGMHAKKPTVEITDSSVKDYVVFGWYTEKECVNEWNFRKDKITGDMTLYAKWGRQYTVNYYVVDERTEENAELSPCYTCTVKEGEKVKEYPEYVVGFEYYGSFADRECTEPFDFSVAVESSADIYMKKSASINFHDDSVSGNLYDNLESVAAGSNHAEGIIAKVGWVEKKVIGENTYTYANFGYSPANPDPYIELTQPLDIRNSQVLTFTFKNLGKSSLFSVFFTTYIDEKQNEYSATGKYYSGTFCKQLTLKNSQRNMSETDDEWIVAEFDMSDILANGYSVWGTSTYLASLRIQSTYNSVSEDDYSNAYIIKSIVGTSKEVTVDDSEEVKSKLIDDGEKELADKSETQADVKGFVFPKNYSSAQISAHGELYNRLDGLLVYSEDEISLRNGDGELTSLTLNYTGVTVDLQENCTFNIRLKNLGYRDVLNAYVFNEEGIRISLSINIDTRMERYEDYFVNLSSQRFMQGSLSKVVIEYESLGVDNALIIEEVYFSEYRPNDIAGVNFNDKFTFGFTSTDKIGVTYDSSLKATEFDVKNDTEELCVTKNYTFTSDGYKSATMQYYVTEKTGVTSVKVGYFIGGEYKYCVYAVDGKTVNRKLKEVTTDFGKDCGGDITGLSISFEGTGKITIVAIEFDLDRENSIDFTANYSSLYNVYDWDGNCKYVYDTSASASKIIPFSGVNAGFRTYIGYVAKEKNSANWYPAENISLTGKKTIKIIYQNRSSSAYFAFNVGLDFTEYGTGETAELQYGFGSTELKTNMKEYEWSVVSFEIPETFLSGVKGDNGETLDYLLAKTEMIFSGTISVRGIVVE